MNTLVIEAPNQITFKDVEIPSPGPNEVLCHVRRYQFVELILI
jgi:hypothetical protein